MSKQDEPFFPERVDEQIDALAHTLPGETPASSSARLVSNLHQICGEETELVERVWMRLTEHAQEKRNSRAGQINVNRPAQTVREDRRKGPQPMQSAPLEQPQKRRRLRWLETLVAALIVTVLVGSTALLIKERQASQTRQGSSPTVGAKTPTSSRTPAVINQAGLYVSTSDELIRINLQTGKTTWRVQAGYPTSVVMGETVFIGAQVSSQPGPGSSRIEAVSATSGQQLWHKDYRVVSYLQGSGGILYASLCEQPITCSIYALKASNGEKLWSYRTASGNAWIKVQDGMVYGLAAYSVFALDASSGKVIWQKSLPSGQQTSTAPQVSNHALYFATCDAMPMSDTFSCYLYAFNASNGENLWHTTVSDYILASPIVVDGVVYAGSNHGALYALNATTGALLWSYNIGNTTIKLLQATHGVVYAEMVAPNGSLPRLLALNIATRSLIWSKNLVAVFGTGPDVPTFALDNGLIYAVDGKQNVSVLKANDGTLAKSYSITASSAIEDFTLVTQN